MVGMSGVRSSPGIEMVKDATGDGGVFDAGDDAHAPAAGFTGVDVDIERALEALRSSHGCTLLDGCFVALGIG